MAKKKQPKRTKLLEHKHTGKLRAHKHTSYGALVLVLVMALLPLMVVSRSASADTTDPEHDAYGVYAVVPAKTPDAPTISSPTSGSTFHGPDPVSVQGRCSADTLVQIYKNGVMAGAALCKSGAYQVAIDLFLGANSLTARAYNANNTPGPDSASVNVTLSALGSASAAQNQFYITADQLYRGAYTGQPLSWNLTIAGGEAPYALNISWGDGKTDLISRPVAGPLAISHTYDQPSSDRGSYNVTVKGSDQAGDSGFLQLVAIVSGDKKAVAFGSSTTGGSGTSTTITTTIIKVAWQLMIVAVLVVASFWLGERHEFHLLSKRFARV